MFEFIFENIYLRRLLALMIDMGIATLIGMSLEFILPDEYLYGGFLPFIVSIVFILLKDTFSIKGSIGKNIFKMRVLKNDGSELKLGFRVLRNFTLLLMPLEILIALLFKGKRLGDIIFHTEVVEG